MMNIIELMNLIIATFKCGAASIIEQHKVLGEGEMNKGRGANRNPYLGGRVLMKRIYSGYVLGTDYATSVANTANRLGGNVTAEEVRKKLKPIWHKPFNQGKLGEWFATDKATESKVYLKLGRNEQNIGHKVVTTYELDGRAATAEEVADIERWLKKKNHTQSSTQTNEGIDSEHEVTFITLLLDTIVSIKQKEKEVCPSEVLSEVYAMATA